MITGCGYRLYITFQSYFLDVFVDDFYTCLQSLSFHSLGKGGPGFAGYDSRVVGNGRYFSDDSAYCIFFNNHCLFTAAYRIDSGTDTGRTGTYDDNIVHEDTSFPE